MNRTDDDTSIRSVSESQLVELGRLLRERRLELGRSIRRVAADAGVSASYVGSLEAAHNPATGRPAAPSLRTLTPLLDVLELDLDVVLEAIGVRGQGHGHAGHAHALLYVMGERRADVLRHAADLCGIPVDRWVYIPDPRDPASEAGHEDDPRAIRLSWNMGSGPYPDRFLRPDRILTALEDDLQRSADAASTSGERIGLVIADCSAVMRAVDNPDAEVDFEEVWADESAAVFERVLGQAPAANVCVYHHADLEALGLEIDALGTALRLLRTHNLAGVLDEDGRIRTGPAAARLMLTDLRPTGVSTRAWRELVGAAAGELTRG